MKIRTIHLAPNKYIVVGLLLLYFVFVIVFVVVVKLSFKQNLLTLSHVVSSYAKYIDK